MATSRRGFLRLAGLNGLAVAAASAAPEATGVPRPPRAPFTQASGVTRAAIRLSSNENSAGPGERVIAAMQESFGIVNRYGFRLGRDLQTALAESLGISPAEVALGCGSSELLDAAAAAWLAPDRGLVTARPTFELLAGRAHALGARVVDVPVDADLRLDLAQMAARARGAGLMYVCNPNNPTGTVRGGADIRAFVREALRIEPRATVLVDEAYHEYVEHPAYESAIALALQTPGVVVTRTFSKIYGMAGLRVGYAVGQPPTLAALANRLDAGRLSCLSLRAALTALGDRERVSESRAQNRAAREATVRALRESGCRVAASDANFVMADVGRDVREFSAACRDRGIEIARPFPPLLTWARITIGTPAEMARAVAVFRDVLRRPAGAAGHLPPLRRHVPRSPESWAC